VDAVFHGDIRLYVMTVLHFLSNNMVANPPQTQPLEWANAAAAFCTSSRRHGEETGKCDDDRQTPQSSPADLSESIRRHENLPLHEGTRTKR
jgi:hypothetical protein